MAFRLPAKLPATARKGASLIHGGYRYRMTQERDGIWRCRRRARVAPCDIVTGTRDLPAARQIVMDILDGRTAQRKRSAENLEEFAKVYLELPKKCSAKVAALNVGRLRAVVRAVLGKELDAVKLHDVGPKLWRSYMAGRQGGKLDLNTRRAENQAINAAVRMAASLFIDRLRPGYAEHGITFPADVILIDWLPVSHRPPAAADDAGLVEWWQAQYRNHYIAENLPLWLAVGLARFAGLRRSEIEACSPDWLVVHDGHDCLALHDRDGHSTKTGRIYYAPILAPQLAEAIRALPKGQPVVQPATHDRHRWFTHELPGLVRPWTGTASKPLHRLRGLYADDVARITSDAVRARLAGIQAASQALGHTTTATTVNHYLSRP